MKKLYILIVLVCCTYSLRAQVLASDSLALVALYNSTNGAGWTHNENWLSGPVPTWFGVSVDNNRVTKLEFCTSCYVMTTSNNMVGTIPTQIGDLTELTNLVMSDNTLSGNIPTEIGNLKKLVWLDLTLNNLEGNIPASIGDLTSLNTIMMAANKLSGGVPKELGNLNLLQTLSLGRNAFTGEIPKEIGNMNALRQLGLNNNQLSGSIPVEIGNLTQLVTINLEFNQLTGEIPVEIGKLTSLRSIYLHWNQITGSIPKEIGQLTDLHDLYLYTNQLTGEIPHEIGQCTQLSVIAAYDNQFSGAIPDELGNLTDLTMLSLYRNNLTGEIPSSLGNLTKLTSFAMSDNQLTGSIPATLGDLTLLDSFDVSNNELTGDVPASLAKLSVARYIVLNGNHLTGVLPSEFGNLPALQYLSLEDNHLTDLPDLSGNTNLTHLSVGNNHLSFGALEPNAGISGFTYNPQTVTFTQPNQNLNEGDKLVISFTTGGASNVYTWWKDGKSVSGQDQSVLTIDVVKPTDAGAYNMVITNPKFSGLFFTTNDVVIGVKPKDIVIPPPPVIVVKTYTITVDNTEKISGNNLSFDLTDVGNDQTKTLLLTNTGNADFTISNIEVTGPFALLNTSTMTVDKGETLELELRFTPDHIGDHTGSLSIISDSDEPIVILDLMGTGEADIEVYNVVTTKVNGKNDFLTIRNIALFPANSIQIFDRWGDRVFASSGYDNINNTFRGISDNGRNLPEGTYFYMIDKHNGSKEVTGFLLLRN